MDTKTQVKIAEHPYRRAKTYLAENPGLATEARDVLWDLRGYVFKCTLIAFGHFEGDHKFYHHLYNNFGAEIRKRSHWRLLRTFVGGHGWSRLGWGPLPGPLATPPDILGHIYENDIKGIPNDWSRRTAMRALIENPNLPEEIIVKTSAADPDESIRTMALKRLGTLK